MIHNLVVFNQPSCFQASSYPSRVSALDGLVLLHKIMDCCFKSAKVFLTQVCTYVFLFGNKET